MLSQKNSTLYALWIFYYMRYRIECIMTHEHWFCRNVNTLSLSTCFIHIHDYFFANTFIHFYRKTLPNQSLQFIGLLVQSELILFQIYQLYCFKILALLSFALFWLVINSKVKLPIKVMTGIKYIKSWSIDLKTKRG